MVRLFDDGTAENVQQLSLEIAQVIEARWRHFERPPIETGSRLGQRRGQR